MPIENQRVGEVNAYICNLPADSLPSLLVCLWQKSETPESLRCHCLLHILRMVGLAISVLDCIHILL